jgi:DNA-binding Lrp family transcriptional regulator
VQPLTNENTHLSLSDLKILEDLATYGPRNVSEVARKLGMPAETLRKKLKRLRSQIFLRTHVNIYHTNLGLRKAVVLAEAIPGYEDLLFNCLKQNGFWIAIARCYGMFEGCVSVFTIPKMRRSEFEQFLNEIKRLGVAKNVDVFWSTCFHSVNSRSMWFDKQLGYWSLQWDSWIEEIKNEQTQLPYTLVDPEDFPILGDEIDVLMLKELEKDATIKISKLAEMLKISPQLARYHFHEHLIGRGLIESFEVSAFHFGRASDFCFFIFSFDNYEKLAKFASSLLDKPFAKTLGKILGKNALYGYIYLPRSEFRNFLKALSKLVKTGFLESYRYVIQDFENSSRQTISYEYFKNGSWTYDHKEHMESLQNMVRKVRLENVEV